MRKEKSVKTEAVLTYKAELHRLAISSRRFRMIGIPTGKIDRTI
jgi:hypothetical protein